SCFFRKNRRGDNYPDTGGRGALGPQEPPPNSPSGKDKEPPKGKPNTMPRHDVECFKADKMPASKVGEFERQLKGQEDGLNRLTVDEYLVYCLKNKCSVKSSMLAR
ncbi:polymorphic toxin type 15 domain-containing protein, partial [Pseudomonas syringae]|uniref:polymorphic toxin type 15 domain-containing protein n=1 Tax=Pseudomonas syringae TaxID=317 RepID=UPI001F538CBD